MTASTSASFPNPPPPDEPPDVYLIDPERPVERQRGVHAHSDWTVGGQVVKKRQAMPLEWPAPLVVAPDSSAVIVRLVTKSPPFEIEIRQFAEIGPDGVPTGHPTAISTWRHTRSSSRRPPELARDLTYDPSGKSPGWDIRVPLPPSSDISYMNVWAQWFRQRDPARLGVDMCSANWKVSARKGA